MKVHDILKYYLGTGLKMKSTLKSTLYDSGEIYTLSTLDLEGLVKYQNKPIFYPLSSLTKSIVVEGYNDGKEFVPIIEIARKDSKSNDYEIRFISVQRHNKEKIEVLVHLENKEREIEFGSLRVYSLQHPTFRFVRDIIQWHFCPWESELERGSWIDKTLKVENG